jgi:hypothetical protein
MPLWQSSVWLAVLATGLWTVGAVLQGRLALLAALLIQCALAVGALIAWNALPAAAASAAQSANNSPALFGGVTPR